MPGKLGDTERRQLSKGPVEHADAGVTGEPRREYEPLRLRHGRMDGVRQGAARRMVAVVGDRARGANADRPVAAKIDQGTRCGRANRRRRTDAALPRLARRGWPPVAIGVAER